MTEPHRTATRLKEFARDFDCMAGAPGNDGSDEQVAAALRLAARYVELVQGAEEIARHSHTEYVRGMLDTLRMLKE